VRLDALAKTFIGSTLTDAEMRAAVADTIDELEMMVDSHASPDYRRRAAKALALRALTDARDAAQGGRA
jgi:CO/xanthine dehydrogenase FAD-binding subunit